MNEIWTRLISTWDNLSPRERILSSAAGGVLAIAVVWFLLLAPLLSAVGDHSDVDNARQQVQVMKRLRSEYAAVEARLHHVEERVRADRGERNLRTLLDNLARTSNVEVASMELRTPSESESYQETRMDVSLNKVTVEQAVQYLHSIESNERPLSIKSLRIKTRTDKTKLLDVTFSVSSFTPI